MRATEPPAPVTLNARAAVRREIGGVERYAREVIARLPAISPGLYRVLAPRPRLAHRAGHGWEQAVLPLLAGRSVVYSPANLAPLMAARSVVVIHDLAALRHPEAYSRAYVAYQRLVLPAVARRAAVVITVSEFSRAELIDGLRLEPSHVEVVSGGVSARFSPAADSATARRALGLERPYVLALGTGSARKDFSSLVRAAAALEAEGVELVLAGGGRAYLRGDPPGLRRLGYVPEEHLPGLIAGSRALAMPSRYEGFGLPCLEAMACGVPVVASDIPALREVCGAAGVLVPPGDGRAMAAALLALVGDEAHRRRLSDAGRERAAAATWERTARLTDGLLRRVAGVGA